MNTRIPMSKEYAKKLQEHPCVLKATQWTVSFTPEFKKMAYDEYCSGMCSGGGIRADPDAGEERQEERVLSFIGAGHGCAERRR